MCAVDHNTSCEWRAPINQIASELSDAPNAAHYLFTRANVLAALTSMIALQQYQVQEPHERAPLTVSFVISAQAYPLPNITDHLVFVLEPVDKQDVKTLLAQIREQNACIIQLTEQLAQYKTDAHKSETDCARLLATCSDLARSVCINDLMTRIIARHGPLGSVNYDFARATFAAEVDGDPIVFKWLGCDHPIWLRSVIRFINVYQTGYQCGTWDNKRWVGGNATRGDSARICIKQWIDEQSEDCRARILVLMPIDEVYDDTCLPDFNADIVPNRGIKCQSQTVILGNPFIALAQVTTIGKCLTKLANNLKTWFTHVAKDDSCGQRTTQVFTARLGWAQSSMAMQSPMDKPLPIHEIDPETAQAYLRASENIGLRVSKLIYPTHILDIVNTLPSCSV
jgi:hypothetical protein